jgi:hypothetical protein
VVSESEHLDARKAEAARGDEQPEWDEDPPEPDINDDPDRVDREQEAVLLLGEPVTILEEK